MMTTYTLSLISLVSIYIILALSLNLIMGLCGQVSLGHAAFYGIGAYIAALLAKAGYGAWVTLPCATLGAGVAGFLVGACSLRVRDDSLAIATMAIGLMFAGIVPQSDFLGGQIGIPNIPSPWTRPVLTAVTLLSAVATVVICIYIERCWLGFAFRAVASDEQAGRMIGIDDRWYKIVAFAIGTAIAGYAGALFAFYLRTVGPEAFGVATSFSLLPMIILGGLGSVAGCIVAATALTLFPEVFQFARDYKLLIFGLLLIAVVFLMPDGIAGASRKAADRWGLERLLRRLRPKEPHS
jgi:branched-chain amino acid transport system permease protein